MKGDQRLKISPSFCQKPLAFKIKPFLFFTVVKQLKFIHVGVFSSNYFTKQEASNLVCSVEYVWMWNCVLYSQKHNTKWLLTCLCCSGNTQKTQSQIPSSMTLKCHMKINHFYIH